MSDRDFKDGWAEYERRFLAAARRGVGKAALQMMTDAINRVPRIPHDEGTLQGSGSVFVDGDLVAVAPDVGGKPTPNTQYEPPVSAETIMGTVGFNTPYAAYQHEGMRADGTHVVDPKNYTRQDGRGPKYLERAMSKYRKDYLAIVAEELQGVG